ncbi:primase-helicase zinc-binding domain-containing protein [Oleidesulfovibrio alaskensis]|jgi:hypothetical protein|uniref:primase-helicase zinc-binding domain-containing protein n=1 Tax=Oleidesulfovibrio alaskensis TaxID=58180 RepID=UPI001A5732D4|nr:primase-helicase zinc-binding domain-containing protein [Oleidesulfovibrio alaskensis]MBL3582606.1 DNA primase [Oleidesulfovibrio alaskensis]
MSAFLDLVRSFGVEPKFVARTGGGEYAGPCPSCGGKDRFRVWPEQEGGPVCSKAGVRGTWFCRREQIGGDAVEFLLHFGGMQWHEACDKLNIVWSASYAQLPRLPKAVRREVYAPRQADLPPSVWRERAARLVDEAHAALLQTPKAMAYLTSRGLPEEAVRRYRLGYLAGENGRDGIFRPLKAWGLPSVPAKDGRAAKNSMFIPRGIVIPAFSGLSRDALPVRVRIRRPDADVAKWGDKYMLVKGGCARSTTVLGENRNAVVVVEAELDAMLVHHVAGDLVCVIPSLTNSMRPDSRAHALLSESACILVALDYDAPGNTGWQWWKETYPQARRWPVPAGKDPGEALQLGEDLRAWILAGLPPALRMGSLASASASGRGEGARQSASGATPVVVAAQPGQKAVRLPATASGGLPPHALWHPMDAAQALRVLTENCGLRVEKAGDDFQLFGHERWPGEDSARLCGWLRKHGALVKEALMLQQP